MHKKFQRVISLKDGSGVQVFKAAHQDQLINELLIALINAVKKIRNQESQLNKYRKFGLSVERKKQ
jgi:hypothetical protein